MDDQTNQTVGFTSREHVYLTSSILEHCDIFSCMCIIIFCFSLHPPTTLLSAPLHWSLFSPQMVSSMSHILSSLLLVLFLSSYSPLLLKIRKVLGSPIGGREERENLNLELTCERTHNICLSKADFFSLA